MEIAPVDDAPLTAEEIREYRQFMQALRAGRMSARFTLWIVGGLISLAGLAGSLSMVWGAIHGSGK